LPSHSTATRSKPSSAAQTSTTFYLYKSSGATELSGFHNYRLEHVIAPLEAGATTESRNRKGEIVWLQTLDLESKSRTTISADFYEKLETILRYGANINA
jgi:hypothetical protein